VLTIKAYNDSWVLGVHSYLSYLQERLYLCRELLSETGSIFVQISDENVHHVREVLDEVFGRTNFMGTIVFVKTTGKGGQYLDTTTDYLLWYAKDSTKVAFHKLFIERSSYTSEKMFTMLEMKDGTCRRIKPEERDSGVLPQGARILKPQGLYNDSGGESSRFEYEFEGKKFQPPPGYYWRTNRNGLDKLKESRRLIAVGRTLSWKQYESDFELTPVKALWSDTMPSGFASESSLYVVQTSTKVIERCILMTTDPGDLIFDPTCGSGTTAAAAEKWGRRWVTCDTSRVAINVARKRLLTATFKHYRTRNGAVSSGFVYKKVPHITLKSITRGQEPEFVELVNNPEIDDGAVRVTGPFEVMSVGRYSIDDWKGYVRQGEKLENYVDVICRLYRKDASKEGAHDYVNAIAESEGHMIALSVGPLSGRVTAKQISDAVEDAVASGINEIHVLGWAFEANVGEIKSKLESRGKIKVNLVMIRPDTLAEGLKVTTPEKLFSPYALPDVSVERRGNSVTLVLKGVGTFDRKTKETDYKPADSGYVSAWYLDEDYDGDCFVDCQSFFDSPDVNLKGLVEADVQDEDLRLQTSSRPFSIGRYERIAVKVIDVYGNESTVVKDLA
jgi:adenine-specific DNA-methyltransferase